MGNHYTAKDAKDAKEDAQPQRPPFASLEGRLRNTKENKLAAEAAA
jgi:hypothetical protein